MHTSNNILCCSGILCHQLKCSTLHYWSLRLALVAISGCWCSWSGFRHHSSWEARILGLHMTRLIVVKANLFPKRTIPTKIPFLFALKTAWTTCSTNSIMLLSALAAMDLTLQAPRKRVNSLGLFWWSLYHLKQSWLQLWPKLQLKLSLPESVNHTLQGLVNLNANKLPDFIH